MLLLKGDTANKDYKRVFDLIQKAAKKGHVSAQLQVGKACVNGEGVKQDLEEAYAWFMVSKENGSTNADQGIQFYGQKSPKGAAAEPTEEIL
jgi:TPR repeat protein